MGVQWDRRNLGFIGAGTLAALMAGTWIGQASRGPSSVPIGPGQPGEVVVQVVGAVERPGVVRMPAGSRVADAVELAGGARSTADLAAVNLAARAADGTQIRIPDRNDPDSYPTAAPGGDPGGVSGGESGAGAPVQGFAGAGTAAPPPAADVAAGAGISINSAGAAELESLPGIGPALAQRILEYRATRGPFRTVDQLDEVKGIGPKTLERLRPYLRL